MQMMVGLEWATGSVPGRLRRTYDSIDPFKEARAFVRSLGLKSEAEWRATASQARSPTTFRLVHISVYANDGWAGMGDWLGTGRIATAYVSIDPSRKPARLCVGSV